MIIESINPATEEIIARFTPTSSEDIDSAIKRAKQAQKQWQDKTRSERISILMNIKENIIKHKKEIAAAVNEECGFDLNETEDGILDIIDGFDYYIDIYKKKNNIDFPIDKDVLPRSDAEIRFYPLGVIAQIGIWNYPFWQTMITVIPALLTGNAILYKPSEHSTKVGLLIADIINNSKDMPKDIFIPIIGGAEQGSYLVKADVDAIVYTGNIKTGHEIIKNAGIKPLILELSGNDSAIICSDCDIDQTLAGVISGAFLHSGEVCNRIKRIYIVKDIAEKFLERAIEKIKALNEQITPLISADALQKVDNQIKKTIEDGAELLIGGKRINKKGFYYEPTLLKLKHNDVESVKNEIFGPVVSLLVIEDENKAIKYANSTKYGLSTSIWTQDFEKAKKIADKAESGMVWINDSTVLLICGEYFQGWKSSSIPNASDRLSMFLKKKCIISFNSDEKRDWWN